jgi:menaquinone-dependent protoporphyrinogen IX oxidase
MRALVIYESMYGNTHTIADAIADGLGTNGDVTVVPVKDLANDLVERADLLVIGSPTHVHGMTRSKTREAAVEAAHKPDADLELDAELDTHAPGLREWFDTMGPMPKVAAAFDTRIDLPVAITGHAAKGIAHRLRKHGATLLDEPTSFFVTKDNHLEAGEAANAREWGRRLGAAAVERAVAR